LPEILQASLFLSPPRKRPSAPAKIGRSQLSPVSVIAIPLGLIRIGIVLNRIHIVRDHPEYSLEEDPAEKPDTAVKEGDAGVPLGIALRIAN
jgi:hypothetical protein